MIGHAGCKCLANDRPCESKQPPVIVDTSVLSSSYIERNQAKLLQNDKSTTSQQQKFFITFNSAFS